MPKIKGLHARLVKEQFETVLSNLGYAFFDNNKKFNLNIIGVRSQEPRANKFDDSIVIIYRNRHTEWEVFSCAATTDPGKNTLLRPENPDGAAILVPNQYRSVYQMDLHGGRYMALCQRGGEVSVYRDDNYDAILNMNKKNIQTGWFGINIHRAAKEGETYLVNKYSAGCQVFQSSRDFYRFMELANISADLYGNSFTYTLITEKQFKENLLKHNNLWANMALKARKKIKDLK